MMSGAYLTFAHSIYMMGIIGRVIHASQSGVFRDPPTNKNVVFNMDSSDVEVIAPMDIARTDFTLHHEADSTKAYVVGSDQDYKVLEFDILN